VQQVEKRTPAGDTRRHLNRALKASKASNSKFSVLQALCRLAEFQRPEVTFTHNQLMEDLRYCDKTIRAAVAFLRAEGSIVPIRHFDGGRGRAPTYRICIVGQGADQSAPEPEAEAGAGSDNSIYPQWADLVRHMGLSANARAMWIEPLKPLQFEGEELTLGAPSGFHAKYVRETYRDKMVSASQALGADLRRINIDG
jgi:hypothetical protein